MHKTFGKDRTCGSGDILEDRHTHTQHTQTYSSKYFVTAPVGKVITQYKNLQSTAQAL